MSTDIIANDLMKMTRSWTADIALLLAIIPIMLGMLAIHEVHFGVFMVAVVSFAYMLCSFFCIKALRDINEWLAKLPSRMSKFIWGTVALGILETLYVILWAAGITATHL